MIPVAVAVAQASARLAQAGVEEPRREARLIIAAALGLDAAGLLAVDEVDETLVEPLLVRRVAREPLAYITRQREFWGLRFAVSPATLIPRPDSETVIEAALAVGRAPRRILDLGTGTGCLLLAALHEYPAAFGVGVDLSAPAVALAAGNAAALGLAARAAFVVGDWARAIMGRFDLILSNPPYIESGAVDGLMPEVARYEPNLALDGGPDGGVAYRLVIVALPALMDDGAVAVLELGVGQADMVAALAGRVGLACVVRPDLAGIGRAAVLRRAK
ncbi:MAG: peptide chain release factor N(5)-glutamine methyltransferase [Acidocella sp.]|nr:peptide chain release factor N(5)-glutamine methyltransferase [Acidocella sp.]